MSNHGEVLDGPAAARRRVYRARTIEHMGSAIFQMVYTPMVWSLVYGEGAGATRALVAIALLPLSFLMIRALQRNLGVKPNMRPAGAERVMAAVSGPWVVGVAWLGVHEVMGDGVAAGVVAGLLASVPWWAMAAHAFARQRARTAEVAP